MPRKAKGPRLYLRNAPGGKKTWIIRDIFGDARTGFAEAEKEQAEAILADYIAGRFRPVRKRETGFIYFVTCLSSSTYPIKIGWACTPIETRLAQLQSGNPNNLSVLATLVATQEDERKLHMYFRHLRVRGEWFLRGADLLEYIGGMPEQETVFGDDEFAGKSAAHSINHNGLFAT